jgi:chlorite dismutase
MPEETPRTLNHFALFAFRESYFALAPAEREALHSSWLAGLRAAAPRVEVYQVYPAAGTVDLLVWSALPVEDGCSTARFFERFARATNPQRGRLQLTAALWGYTRPSQYTRARSAQEIDPFAAARQPYLVIYPFVKTADWYLLGREARQGLMNEHIRIGKQYDDIQQLLLYSFGLQDQEFVVVYETADLARFSDLVSELRGSDARRYTERDTPVHIGVHHPAEETLELWS